jgi:predicted Zn finger-like uncharacterized protein
VTGDRGVQAAADAEQTKLDGMFAVTDAMRAATGPRFAELAEVQRAAWRRHSAAKEQLNRAQRDGNAERIAAAKARLDATYTEADRLADVSIREMLAINETHLANLGEILGQVGPTWDAQVAAGRPVSAAELYACCPGCGFIAPPESMDYALTGPPPDGDIDWSQPVHVTCMICRAHYDITGASVPLADAEVACKRCDTAVAYPAAAARVRCTGCGLFLIGPGLDARQLEELRSTEGLANVALREAYVAARKQGGGPEL